jgi:hypothetical protein
VLGSEGYKESGVICPRTPGRTTLGPAPVSGHIAQLMEQSPLIFFKVVALVLGFSSPSVRKARKKRKRKKISHQVKLVSTCGS